VSIFSNLFSRTHRAPATIELRDSGFAVSGHVVAWTAVTEIRAYKLDLLTTDEIRLVFRLRSGEAVEISEEQPGFAETTAAIASRFPSTSEWYNRVAHPAFATNETVLYAAV
jgi:hypothetical protein